MNIEKCPFCGYNHVELLTASSPDGIGFDVAGRNLATYLLCSGCGAATLFRPSITGQQAVAMWNKREGKSNA